MKSRTLLLIAALLVTTVLVGLTPTGARAATGLSGSQITVPANQTINDDVYAAGSTITIDGRINGNLVAAGSTLDINGTVTGTVIAGAATTTINGKVDGTVIGIGGTMTVNGRVTHDITWAGGTLTVAPSAAVGRDVVTASGSLIVNGHVARNVRSSSRTVTLGSGAVIGGLLSYTGKAKPQVASGATVRGPVEHQAGEAPWTTTRAPWDTGLSVVAWLRNLIGFLIFGLLVLFLAPVFGRRGIETLQQHPFSSLGWGALTLVVTPLAAVLMFILGLLVGGWWISLIVLALYGIALALGLTLASLFLGEYLSARVEQIRRAHWLSFVIGASLLMIVSIIPVLGGLVVALAAIWGLGGVMGLARRSLPLDGSTASVPVASLAPPAAKAS